MENGREETPTREIVEETQALAEMPEYGAHMKYLKSLEGMPEEIREICIRQHEVFMTAPKSECSFNLFTRMPEYASSEALNKNTKDKNDVAIFKQVISQEGFWTEEREQLQEYGVQRQFDDAVRLSESMRTAEREMGIGPTIYILCGAPGSGKTFASKNAGLPGMIVENGEPIGTLATDNSKTDLYKAGGTSDQIHAESSLMYKKLKKRWMEHVKEMGGDCSEIHDRVFDDPGDIEEIIENAKRTGRRIQVIDIDVPYAVSAVRILQRGKDEPQPHPGGEYLEKVFMGGRRNRFSEESLIKKTETGTEIQRPLGRLKQFEQASLEGIDIDYQLLCYDYDGEPPERQKKTLVARTNPETRELETTIFDEKLYRRTADTKFASEEVDFIGGPLEEYQEIDGDEIKVKTRRIGGQVITKSFVDWYLGKYCAAFPDDAKKATMAMSEYISRGLTVYQALNDKNL